MNCNSNLLFFSLGTFFLLLLNHANAENKTEPRQNVNLSPFESMRSAYFCLMNRSGSCTSKTGYILNIDGVLNVQDSDITDYCLHGCYNHTKYVLQCIQDVRKDFRFGTKQPISYVGNVTEKACNQFKGFNTNVTNPNSATNMYGRFTMPLVSTLTTMAFIATLGV